MTEMYARSATLALVVLFLGTTGCTNNQGPVGCETFVDTFANQLFTCMNVTSLEAGRAAIRLQLEMASMITSCEDVRALRDETEFYDACIPGIAALACDGSEPLPEACRGQLQVDAR